MLNSIQITAQAQPHASMLIDEVIEAGQRVLPTEDGRWTIFSANIVYTKDDTDDNIGAPEVAPGRIANRPVVVTWSAADDVAYQISAGRYREEVARQQALQQQPKILVPEPSKLIT